LQVTGDGVQRLRTHESIASCWVASAARWDWVHSIW
jgi:hypothetical protein